MHVVGQFRYGAATKSGPTKSVFTSGPSTTVTNAGSQHLREDHWLVDFGIVMPSGRVACASPIYVRN